MSVTKKRVKGDKHIQFVERKRQNQKQNNKKSAERKRKKEKKHTHFYCTRKIFTLCYIV